ncbi:MAG TPA: extracellular solute-binding protein, partial [Homoserinimonas sp.]|nr:extracellular solute-binding protein [Homoserinimonas sp.]
MNKKLGTVAIATAAALILVGCSTTEPADEGGTDITMWLMGGDTPDELRDFLKTEYADATGGTLTIEEQAWGDALAKLTTSLPDSENTPDVVEIGNTWSPTFTGVGAFSDLSDIYEELGGDKLLPSFVEVGEVDGAQMALPYYFGSRYVFYRKDIWAAAGKDVPATLEEFNQTAAELRTDSQSGFYLGGQDWRNGVSWIFANDGELAVKDGDKWVSSLSDPNTIKGLEQLQELYTSASNAPVTEADSTPWVNINNNDATGAPEAA